MPTFLCSRAMPAIRFLAGRIGRIPSTVSSTQEPFALADGDTLLLCRVEDRTRSVASCARRAQRMESMDGASTPEPTLTGNPREYPEEIWGIEDPRITYVPELEQYAVAYTSFARGGPGVSLALTKDFQSFERFGVIMPPEDKDAALLPRRINGYWAMIHRPVTTSGRSHVDLVLA